MAAKKGDTTSVEDAQALYGLSLAEFTAARNALAKRLRDDGERDEAAAVKALGKPSLPAWAINQAVSADPKAAKALIGAGEGLRKAHEGALGGKADKLHEAMTKEADAVDAMARAAQKAAGGEALGPAMVDRVRDTLRAVAGDDELRAEFEAGRIERDRKPVGLGGAFSPGAPSATPKRAKKGAPTAAQRKRAEQAAAKARKALDAARKRSVDAAAELEKARKAMKQAQGKAAEADRDEKQAEEELEAAEAASGELAGD